MKSIFILIIALNCFLGAIGSFFLKKSTNNLKFNLVSMFSNRYLVAGGMLFLASTIIFIWVLKFVDLSLAFPLTATSYIWVILISNKFLDEKIHFWKIISIVLIIIGSILISLS
ncbi:MAG: EamA family transporter [Nanoarchaeota archaeon]